MTREQLATFAGFAAIFILVFISPLFSPLFKRQSVSQKKDLMPNAAQDPQAQLAELQNREDLRVATFAGGCFWCMEGPFEALEGVEEAITGYAGGEEVDPSYEEVASGRTGHREAVQVFYDPEQVSYQELLDIYWRQIDPTDDGGQFTDRGPQYRSAIFYTGEEERRAAEDSREALAASGHLEGEIATEILPYITFYPAESYHQDYYQHSAERYQRYKEGSGRASYIRDQHER